MEIKTKFNIGDEIKTVESHFTQIEGKVTGIAIAETEDFETIEYEIQTKKGNYYIQEEHLELVPKSVLDKKEKEYLENIVRPFKKRVQFIYKIVTGSAESKYCYKINIILGTPYEVVTLPAFTNGSMYAGMIDRKKYTLEELNLFK